MPLLYSSVSGRRIDGGIGLARESVEIGINFAAIWEVMPSDKEISLEGIFDRFDALEVKPGESRFDQTLTLLISQIEEIAGSPLRRVSPAEFNPRELPYYAIVECPLLFHVRDRYTYQLLRELSQLLRWHNWDEVRPALRRLLTHATHTPYPELPDRASDSRLYVVPANDSQRRAVAAASKCPLTVVTGPPGTGKSQLIVNIVSDAVLRGETVLIASRNNRAVDVVHDRFLGQVDYPGTVRSGKWEYRQRLPGLMRRVLSTVRRGDVKNRWEQIHGEYAELLQQIDEQQALIKEIEGLQRDQQAYYDEIRDLTDSLPAPLGESVRKGGVSLDATESNKLKTALRALEEEAVALVEQRQALARELRDIIAKNREGLTFLERVAALERHSGVSLESLRPGTSVEDFAAIEGYLTAWESLTAAIRLQDKARRLRNGVTELQRRAGEIQEKLPAELVAGLDSAAEQFSAPQEQALRQSLEDLEKEVQGMIGEYHRLVERLVAIGKRSPALRSLFRLMAGKQAAGLASYELDLLTLKALFAIKDNLLEAHHAGTTRADLQRRLRALKQERASKLAEIGTALAGLEERLTATRAGVPAMLITQIELVSERETHKGWKTLAIRLRRLAKWCRRIHDGQLTLEEHLRQILSSNWARRHLQRDLCALRAPLASLGILDLLEEPASHEPFEKWGTYVHHLKSFVHACFLVAQRRYVLEQQQAYREKVEREIADVSAQLEEANTRFMHALARLPEPIAQAMLGDNWLFEPIPSPVAQDLEMVKEQFIAFVSQYTSAVERLDALNQEHASSVHIHTVIQALKLDAGGSRSSATGVRPTPAAMMKLVTSWLQFSYASEAEYRLRQAQHVLSETEEELGRNLARLPAAVREFDFTSIQYSAQLVQPMEQSLSMLRAKLEECLEEWRNLQKRAVGLLQDNELGIRALSKAHKRAKKDPDYLAGLAGRRAYDRPEHLLDDLRLWRQVAGIWRVRSRLSEVSKRLKKLPTLDEAKAELDHLLEEQVSLAGRILAERWRQTAAELDPATIRRIGYYVDAVDALASNAGPRGTLRREAERYFVDALKLFPVWSTTNLSTQDLPLQAGLFDCVVIDEASQCDIPSALPLLFRAKRIVIIGDDRQLTHIATLPKQVHQRLLERYAIASRYSYPSLSLFDLAARSTAGVPGQILLNEHYRSHEEIIEFSNQHFYEGDLRVKTNLSKVPALYKARGCGLFWVNVEGHGERAGPGRIYNKEEQRAVLTLVERLLKQLDSLGMTEAEIGIVTPFRAQAEEIQRALKRLRVSDERILVGTVHTYQGNERDIMIFSTVATEDLPEGTRHFVTGSPNLLNVAVTRARLTLIVIGDHSFFLSLPKASCYYKLAAYARDLGKVYPDLEHLPLFLPVEDSEAGFELGHGLALQPNTPYRNRMTLRRLLASCQEYLWWYDSYMNVDALDALALALSRVDQGQIREVRLLTGERYWGNPEYLTKKAVTPLKREFEARGIKLWLAVIPHDRDNPSPHDRYLFSANLAVNMPPIKNIYEYTARLAEFLPSTVKSEEFESWWERARVVLK